MFIKHQGLNCSKLTGLDPQFQNHPNFQQRTRNSPLRIGRDSAKVRPTILAGGSPGPLEASLVHTL